MTAVNMRASMRAGNKLVDWLTNWLGALHDGWRAAIALAFVSLSLVAIEFAQHVVEMSLGFFSTDMEVRKAASTEPLRMAFGWPKMAMVWILGFFAVRWLVLGEARAALRPSFAALRQYAWVVLFQLIPVLAIIYAEPITAMLGWGQGAVLPFRALFGLGQQLIEPALCLWIVSAALGSNSHGPIASAKATRWLYLWALPLLFLSRLPFNVLHQFLNRWPVGKEPASQWLLLAVDSLLVVALVTVAAAAQVRVARYVSTSRGIAFPR